MTTYTTAISPPPLSLFVAGHGQKCQPNTGRYYYIQHLYAPISLQKALAAYWPRRRRMPQFHDECTTTQSNFIKNARQHHYQTKIDFKMKPATSRNEILESRR